MLYDIVALNRESSLRTSHVGCEKAIMFSPHTRLDTQFQQTIGGYYEEPHIGIGALLETNDPELTLKPPLFKGLGYTHSVSDGAVCYEILFYQKERLLHPYKLTYRTSKNPVPEELVNYNSCSIIYPDMCGGTAHVSDPRLEVLSSYQTDDAFGTGQGAIDLAVDTLSHHPLFGVWARHSLSANVVSSNVKSIMSQVQMSAVSGRLTLHPNVLTDKILPLEMPSSLGRIIKGLSPDPNTWSMQTSQPISFTSQPLQATCSDVSLNPPGCMPVADVLSTLAATDLCVVLRCQYNTHMSDVELLSYSNRYVVSLGVSQTSVTRDLACINQLCPYTLISHMEKKGYENKRPLFIKIEKTFNEEALISFSYDGTTVFHQIYLDLALLSLCSMGVSVIG